MGLLTVIRKVRRKQHEIRLLMVGLDNAGTCSAISIPTQPVHPPYTHPVLHTRQSPGKTTVVKFLSGDDISTVSPTLGFNIKTLQHHGYSVNIWDVGGQKTLRSYWRNYFEQTDGLVWVVDSADKVRWVLCWFACITILTTLHPCQHSILFAVAVTARRTLHHTGCRIAKQSCMHYSRRSVLQGPRCSSLPTSKTLQVHSVWRQFRRHLPCLIWGGGTLGCRGAAQ